MIKISANTDNTIWVNASRNKTLSNPTYLMSLEHKVSGDRKYFIPQNITSFSGSTTYQEDPRVDLFKFGVYESGENLTGGTRSWFSLNSPNYVNDDVRLKGTGKSYPSMYPWQSSSFGVISFQFDWEDVNDRMDDVNDTGFTITFNDILYTGNTIVVRDSRGGGTDEVRIAAIVGILGFPLNEIEKISYTGTSTGGTSISNTIYVANWEEVAAAEPWTYYGDELYDGLKSYPITPLGTTNISLENYGWYYYRIYEQTSQTNLNPLLTTDVVDEGTLYLYPPPPDEVSYEGYSTDEIIIYDEDRTPTNHILQENEYHLLTENNELLTQE
jgi:hypothetical protein